MSAKTAALLSIVLAGSLLAGPASASAYDLLDYPLSFQGAAVAATAKLTTDFRGTLTDEGAIEALLNSATYAADLYGSAGTLTHLDNSNSRWDLSFSGVGATALLDVRDTGMLLSFATVQEFSGALLLLRSLDGLSVLQYRQENNVSDSNLVFFTFNAVHGAIDILPYGSTFLMPAAPIPEPEVLTTLALGLFFMRWATRKRRRPA